MRGANGASETRGALTPSLARARREKLTLNLWCCGGETRLRPLVQQLYEGARAALLVYSMGSAASFQELAYWYNEMRRAAPGAALVLVGTHSDAADRIRVTEDDGLKQARAWGVAHFAVSSATGRGVEELFAALARLLAPPAEENAAE